MARGPHLAYRLILYSPYGCLFLMELFTNIYKMEEFTQKPGFLAFLSKMEDVAILPLHSRVAGMSQCLSPQGLGSPSDPSPSSLHTFTFTLPARPLQASKITTLSLPSLILIQERGEGIGMFSSGLGAR